MFVYMYVHVCKCVHVCVNVHMCVNMCVYVYMCVCVHMCATCVGDEVGRVICAEDWWGEV